MLKKLLLLLLLITATAASASAQTNFRPGYVVTLGGDTLRGEVESRLERFNATLCRFRSTGSPEVIEYQPAQLLGYGLVAGPDYESHVTPTRIPSNLFMRRLVGGRATLYRVVQEDGNELFFARWQTEANLLPLLQRDSITLNEQGLSASRTLYPFRAELWKRMADCPSVQVTLARLEAKESQLLEVFTNYNRCVGSLRSEAVASQVPRTRLALVAGMQQATIEGSSASNGATLDSGWQPVAGIGLTIAASKYSDALSLHIQALYTKQSYDGYLPPTANTAQNELHVRLQSIELPLFVRYSLLQGKIRPFVQVGGTFAYRIQKDAYTSRLSTFPPVTLVTKPIDLRAYGTAVMGGVGLSFGLPNRNLVSIEGRYNSFDSTSAASGVIAGSRGFMLVGSYLFGK